MKYNSVLRYLPRMDPVRNLNFHRSTPGCSRPVSQGVRQQRVQLSRQDGASVADFVRPCLDIKICEYVSHSNRCCHHRASDNSPFCPRHKCAISGCHGVKHSSERLCPQHVWNPNLPVVRDPRSYTMTDARPRKSRPVPVNSLPTAESLGGAFLPHKAPPRAAYASAAAATRAAVAASRAPAPVSVDVRLPDLLVYLGSATPPSHVLPLGAAAIQPPHVRMSASMRQST